MYHRNTCRLEVSPGYKEGAIVTRGSNDSENENKHSELAEQEATIVRKDFAGFQVKESRTKTVEESAIEDGVK